MSSGAGFPEPRGADAVPVLAGRHVRLRAITQADYPFLVELQTAPDNIVRWRYRGTSTSPEAIVQSLWQGVLAQFVVVRIDTAESVGLVACYNPDFRHSHAYLAMIVAPQFESTGWPLEAVGIFISYLFEEFGFHKLYMESLEFNYQRIASGAGSIFHVEGCLRDHETHFGVRWHQYLLALYANEWHDTIVRLAPELARRSARIDA